MNHKNLFKTTFLIISISATLVLSIPLTVFGKDNTISSQRIVNQEELHIQTTANENNFTIQNGTLVSYQGDATSVTIPNTVTSIGEYAFEGCTNLIKIVIPETVTSIGAYAFESCTNLETIVIPKSVKNIEMFAFEDTKWLENQRKENPLVIVNSILIDGQNASGKIVIPDNVQTIAEFAFFKNSNLKEIVISENITDILSGTFSECIYLEKVTIPESVENISWYAFFKCNSLKEIVIPKSVKEIESTAFGSCTNLEKVVISEGVENIGGYAFSKCNNLKEIVLPKSVTSIGQSAFEACHNLKNIVISQNVTSIGGNAFADVAENFCIYGKKDSYVYQYAKENNISFTILEENLFTDVATSAYYYVPVIWAYNNNITKGFTATEFAPEEACTRGQVITFLWRAMGQPESSVTINPFIDVNKNDYYYKAILWAYENHITVGIDSNHFAPEQVVTRGEFMTFLHRVKGTPQYSIENVFSDIAKDMYYYDAVLWGYENQITNGIDSNHFKAEDFCTRGQAVTFLYRTWN